MKHTFLKYWRIFWLFRNMHAMRTFEYRLDFIFWSVVSTMWTLFNYFFFHLLTNVSGNLAGWNLAEMYVLISIFTILDGIFWSFFIHNVRSYTESIFTGNLNSLLVKPVDTQFLLMTQNNSLSNVPRIVLGIGLLIGAVQRLDQPVTISQVLLASLAFVCGALSLYFLTFLVATLAFYVEKLDNINEVVPSLRRIWQVPRQVYSGVLSMILTAIVPLALVISLPSEFIIGRGSLGWLAFFVVQTAVLMWVSRHFFAASIKRYSGIAN